MSRWALLMRASICQRCADIPVASWKERPNCVGDRLLIRARSNGTLIEMIVDISEHFSEARARKLDRPRLHSPARHVEECKLQRAR